MKIADMLREIRGSRTELDQIIGALMGEKIDPCLSEADRLMLVNRRIEIERDAAR